jgi:hypothetical protein
MTMSPDAAALFAARAVRETLPDEDTTGVVLQVVGPDAILSLALPEVPAALELVDVLAALAVELVLVADAYHATLPADGTIIPDHGDLQERHLIGDPTVTEALIVVGAKRTEETSRVTVMPYARDTGQVLWAAPLQLQPFPDEAGISGVLASALTDALAHTPAPAGATTTAMHWAATQLTDHGYAADVLPR